MKTLEQLGVSPAPWRINDHASVLDRYFEIISGQYGPYNWHNASLIAAAPELYDMLQSLVEYIDRECIPCGETACELMAAAHNVLAKAAGESEVER